jgi:hypothetical protein
VACAEPLDDDTEVALVPVLLDEPEVLEPVVVEVPAVVAAVLPEDAVETS